MELGAYIRRRRQAAGLSLRKLAELTRVNPAYLSRVERDIVPPSEALIQTIAAALGIEFAQFGAMTGKDPGGQNQHDPLAHLV